MVLQNEETDARRSGSDKIGNGSGRNGAAGGPIRPEAGHRGREGPPAGEVAMGKPRVTLRGVLCTVLLPLALSMAACGNNGVAPAGTGVSAGTIARFEEPRGISVNGLVFDTGAAEVEIDDVAGFQEGDLAVGMQVVVTGPVNEAAGTGQAERIEVVKAVQGPLDDLGVDIADQTLSVMGRTVFVLPATIFDNVTGLEELKAIQAGVPESRPVVEVHGAVDNVVPDGGGLIHASFIRLRADDFDPAEPVSVRGIVAPGSIVGDSFRIGSLFVDFPMPVPGLADGAFVEARGTFDPGVPPRIDAADVRVLDERLGDTGDAVRLEGYVAAVLSIEPSLSTSAFTVITPRGPQEIRTNPFTDIINLTDLDESVRLAAEGEMTALGLLARRVRFLGPDPVAMRHTPTAVDPSGGTMTLMTKTVAVDDFTLFQDSALALRAFALADIGAQDTVRVVGRVDHTTVDDTIRAALVERVSTIPVGSVGGPDILLQGVIEKVNEEVNEVAHSLVLLGIEVDLASNPIQIEYRNRDGSLFAEDPLIGRSLFLTAVEPGLVVSVERGTFTGLQIIAPAFPPPMTLRIETINE
jgi:hypothetical protein